MSLDANALCSLVDAKRYADQLDDSGASDAFYEQLINGFSTAAAKYCGREWPTVERIEYFDAGIHGGPGGGTNRLFLRGFPVDLTATFKVYNDPTYSFAEDTLLTRNSDYVVNAALGVVAKLSPAIFEVGFVNSPVWGNDRFQAELQGAFFTPGRQVVKVQYTGGLLTARPGPPGMPSVEAGVGAGLLGQYRYAITTVVEATGIESVATDAVQIVANETDLVLTWSNPGAGKRTRIYRTRADATTLYLLTAVAGFGTPGLATQSFSDATPDDQLTTGTRPPDAGPVTIPEDLRTACMAQVTHWFSQRNKPGVFDYQSTGEGRVVFERIRQPFLPFVTTILDHYRRID